MANERIKKQVEPVAPKVVAASVENAMSTYTGGGEVEQQKSAIIKDQEKVIPAKDITQKIYVGPNILGLPTYTVIETDFTPHIESFIEKCPDIEKLFVPIAEMSVVESRTKVKGTLENRYFNAINEFIVAEREVAN
ncbi:hypothetical protein ABFY60_26875 [Lysinibacillus pakistanensis]|uniref:hypothetical protein n=1 Tax=Lysinibacillus pakistanensis TaxID=759811 RepID=UPI003D2E3EC7